MDRPDESAVELDPLEDPEFAKDDVPAAFPDVVDPPALVADDELADELAD